MGGSPEGRTRHGKIPSSAQGHPAPGTPLRGRAPLPALFPNQPRTYALPRVSRPRLMHFHGCGRSRMQSGHRYTPQTHRHALDRARLQRHHRASLLKTQRPLSGLLGTQVRTQGRMTHHFLVVHPGEKSARGDALPKQHKKAGEAQDCPHGVKPRPFGKTRSLPFDLQLFGIV